MQLTDDELRELAKIRERSEKMASSRGFTIFKRPAQTIFASTECLLNTIAPVPNRRQAADFFVHLDPGAPIAVQLGASELLKKSTFREKLSAFAEGKNR